MNRAEKVYLMTTEPVGSLILKNAVPTIISMMVTAIYNTADTFFVSKLGTSASGAVGIIFSIMAIIQAFGFTIGMGSGSIVSRKLGSNEIKIANKVASTAIVTSFLLGMILACLGILFQNQIIIRLGATNTILPYAKDYARYIFIGIPFIMTSFVMNNQLRWQGSAVYGMVGLTTGGILNIILDPIFIYGLKMGISGAAVATLCSQCVSFSILLFMFLRKKAVTELSLKNVSRELRDYFDIFRTGLPSFCRQGIGSLAMIFLNTQAGLYGMNSALCGYEADAAIASMAISHRLFMLLMSVALGLGQGFQPVCGMNFGAKKFDRVKKGFFFLVKITALCMGVLSVFIFIFPGQITKFFRDDANVINVSILTLRAQALVLPLHSIIFAANMLLQSTGKPGAATFLSSLRQGIYFIPLIFLLPLLFDIRGIQLAQSVADFLTAATSVPFVIKFFRELESEKI